MASISDVISVAHGVFLLLSGLAWSVARKFLKFLGPTRSKYPVIDGTLGYFLGRSSVKQKRLIFDWFAHAALEQLKKAKQGVVTISSGIHGIWYKPDPAHAPDVVLMYVHGGAMVCGNPASGGPVMVSIIEGLKAQGLTCYVLAVKYSLAPEHPFPCGLAEVIDTVIAEQQHWQEPASATQATKPPAIVLMGDSAGANLVMTSLLALHTVRAGDAPLLRASTTPCAGAVLISPWLDLSPDQEATKCMPHVYPCAKPTVPPTACECTALHKDRHQADIIWPSFIIPSAGLYVEGTPAYVRDAAPPADSAQAADGQSRGVRSALLQHVKQLMAAETQHGYVNALLRHPLVSPGQADPAVAAAALRSLLHSPGLVLAGELEIMLPDIQRMVDRVNQAAADHKRQAAAGSSNRAPLQLEVWPREIHGAVLMPMRDDLVPGIAQYIATVTRAWQASRRAA